MKNIYSLIIIICFSFLLCDQNSTNHNTNSHDLNHKHNLNNFIKRKPILNEEKIDNKSIY